MATETEKLFTAEEVAEQLRVRVRHVYELVRKGDLVGLRIGRYLRFAPADLHAYLARARTENSAGGVVPITRRLTY